MGIVYIDGISHDWVKAGLFNKQGVWKIDHVSRDVFQVRFLSHTK